MPRSSLMRDGFLPYRLTTADLERLALKERAICTLHKRNAMGKSPMKPCRAIASVQGRGGSLRESVREGLTMPPEGQPACRGD